MLDMLIKTNTYIENADNLGKVYIEITELDANDLLSEDCNRDWVFPVYCSNNKVVGYVDVALGRDVKNPAEECDNDDL